MNNNKMKTQSIPSKSVNMFDTLLDVDDQTKSLNNINNNNIKQNIKKEGIKQELPTVNKTDYIEDSSRNERFHVTIERQPTIKQPKKLHTPWDVYFHDFPSNNWSPTSYDYIFEIKTVVDFWKLFKQIDKINTYTSNLFIMRSGIEPLWESEDNRNGGECSICVDADKSNELLELLSILIMDENLVNNPTIINGISVVTKKITTHDNPDGKNSSYIKIWTRTRFSEIQSIIDKKISHTFPQLSFRYKEYDKPNKKGIRKLKY